MTDKKEANLAKTIAKLEDKIEIALKMLEMSKKDRLDAIEARLDALEAKAKPRISFNGTDEIEQPKPDDKWKAVYREAYMQAYGATIQKERDRYKDAFETLVEVIKENTYQASNISTCWLDDLEKKAKGE